MNRLQLYLFLARILGLDDENAGNFKRDILPGRIPPEQFIHMADRHLVLQALYPKIGKYSLEEFFPQDLTGHLQYIFQLNEDRNRKVVEQCHRLNHTLNRGGISPLFMKGAGNLLDNLYQAQGERILHDIDILVREDEFENSVALLRDDGYINKLQYDPLVHGSSKHYPILHKPGDPVYLEVHRMPVGRQYLQILNTEIVFAEKQPVPGMPGSFMMSAHHRIIHNFVHSQLEHSGHYYARGFLRNLYDLLLLSARAEPAGVLMSMEHSRRKAAGYLDIYSKAFGLTLPDVSYPKLYLHLYSVRYHANLRYRRWGKVSLLIQRLFRSFVDYPAKALFSGTKRKILIRKILDPAWYRKQVVYYGRFFRMRR